MPVPKSSKLFLGLGLCLAVAASTAQADVCAKWASGGNSGIAPASGTGHYQSELATVVGGVTIDDQSSGDATSDFSLTAPPTGLAPVSTLSSKVSDDGIGGGSQLGANAGFSPETQTPEPGTIGLLVVGILTIAARRRMRKA
jgi:hypothetical protein